MAKLLHYDAEELIARTFETVFRPCNENGYYDEKEGIYSLLRYRVENGTIKYFPSNEGYWRYNPFLMMGILYSRFHLKKALTGSYDDQIKKQLKIMGQRLKEIDIVSLNSYTLGPLMVSYSFAYAIYIDDDYLDIINLIFENTNFKIEVNEDGFLLLGLCYLYENIPEFRECTLEKIDEITEEILKHQDRNGLFVFKNLSSKRHQNQMYTLWALNRAFAVLDRKNTGLIKKNIQYTIENRMQDDYGIIWENEIPLWFKLYHFAKKLRYWEYYFECHQCFFAHAAFEYAALTHDKEFNEHAKRALEWILGRNRFGIDLLEFSGLGIPHRIVDSHGNLHLKGQQFKGTYEIGGYLMALTDFLTFDS